MCLIEANLKIFSVNCGSIGISWRESFAPLFNFVKSISKIIEEEMSSVNDSDLHSFSTPLTVDVNIGDNWGILH